MDIAQRLEFFFRRLTEAPPAASAEEALALVCQLIEAVEDEFCPVPKQEPEPLEFTGRMYAPHADNIRYLEAKGILANTRRHLIICTVDGSITITYKPTKTVELVKKGKV